MRVGAGRRSTDGGATFDRGFGFNQRRDQVMKGLRAVPFIVVSPEVGNLTLRLSAIDQWRRMPLEMGLPA